MSSKAKHSGFIVAYTGIGRALAVEDGGSLMVPQPKYPVATLFKTKRRAMTAIRATIAMPEPWRGKKLAEFVVVKLEPEA